MAKGAATPPKELPHAVSLERFLIAATSDFGARDHVELSSHLYAAFKRWCSQKLIKPMSVSAFGRELGKTGDYEPDRVGSDSQKAWRDIRLRPRWKEIAQCATQSAPAGPPPFAALNRPKRIHAPLLVGRFLAAATKADGVSVELFSELFHVHLKWCEAVNYQPLTPLSFGKGLTKLHIDAGRVGNGRHRVRRGIRLLPIYQAAWAPAKPEYEPRQ
ncbi:MAG: hypothetical protein ACLPPF_21745 [Rhodomicrobium sp.]